MEFEAGSLRFRSDKLAAKRVQGQTRACKGHSVRYRGDSPGGDWALRADIDESPGLLHAAYILNGKHIKIGTGDLKKSGGCGASCLSSNGFSSSHTTMSCCSA